jgi:hypothetical protein
MLLFLNLLYIFDNLAGVFSFRRIEYSLVDVGMQIWFCITTLLLQIENSFYM